MIMALDPRDQDWLGFRFSFQVQGSITLASINIMGR